MTSTSMKLTRRRFFHVVPAIVGMQKVGCVRRENATVGAPTRGEQLQKLVNLATVSMTRARGQARATDALLSRCLAVLVAPSVDAASLDNRHNSFEGVLCARARTTGARSPDPWTGPAFFQLSVARTNVSCSSRNFDLLLFIMNARALQSLVSYSVTLGPGGDLSVGQVTAGSLRKGQQLHEDVYQQALDASGFVTCPINPWRVSSSTGQNQLYYGNSAATAKAIVIEHRFANPEAGLLLRALQNENVYQDRPSVPSGE